MIKILSTSQVREADTFTIQNEPIASIDLMERASKAFVGKFTKLYNKRPVSIFCGTGNNGGDGLAIGRLLEQQGWEVHAYVIGNPEKGSRDFKTNLNRWRPHTVIHSVYDLSHIHSNEIILDGLFGSGLTRPIEGLPKVVIQYLNAMPAARVSIDIASGLFADRPVVENAVVFKPTHTISFQFPKLAFMLPEYYEYVGHWHIVDIGLHSKFAQKVASKYYLIERTDLRGRVPKRQKFDHKGKAGRLVLVSGSKGKMGATVLAARAALRSGIGLLTIHCPKCGTTILQTTVPEAMVNEDVELNEISKIPITESTIGAGPGIGVSIKTCKAIAQLIENSTKPLLLDADAINIIAQNPELLNKLPPESVLTPHAGEFKRLVGVWRNDYEKLEKLSTLCREYQLNIVLKGAFSAVCDSEGTICFNPTGNPGMATGGSGDVLTGIVSSLMAQNLHPYSALMLGVYVHGLAGDMASTKKGRNGMIASDIIDHLFSAFNCIHQNLEKN